MWSYKTFIFPGSCWMTTAICVISKSRMVSIGPRIWRISQICHLKEQEFSSLKIAESNGDLSCQIFYQYLLITPRNIWLNFPNPPPIFPRLWVWDMINTIHLDVSMWSLLLIPTLSEENIPGVKYVWKLWKVWYDLHHREFFISFLWPQHGWHVVRAISFLPTILNK